MARLLRALKPDRARRERIAVLLGVTERTLRNWQRRLEEPGRPEGRPPHSPQARFRCALAVARLLRNDGYRLGEGEVLARLEERGAPHPRRVVRRVLSGLKARRRRRQRAVAKKLRLRLAPLDKDVLWSLDATHFGYQADGTKLVGQMIVDVANGEALAASVGASPCAVDAIMLLDHARVTRGRLPYALAIDNGFDTKALRRYLREHRVLRLVNLPATPEHNCWIERAFGLVKGDLRERLEDEQVRGGATITLTALVGALRDTVLDVNARRRARSGQGCKRESPFGRDRRSTARYDRRLHERLVHEYQLRRDQIRAENSSTRRTRQLERYALMETLRDAGLVDLTRGGEPWDQAAWERLT